MQGFETHLPINGWPMCERDTMPDDPLARREELGKLTRLDMTWHEALATIGANERDEVVRTADDGPCSRDANGRLLYENVVVIPVIDKKNVTLRGFSPQLYRDDPKTLGLVYEWRIPEAIRDFALSLPRDEAAALPRVPETEKWFSNRQQIDCDSEIVVSAEKFSRATGQDVVATLSDHSGRSNRSAVVSEAPTIVNPAP